MKTSDRLADITALQNQEDKVRSRVKGFMDMTGASKGVKAVKKASDMVNGMSKSEKGLMEAQMPRPTMSQRVKRMTEWFTTK